jgi:PAS domain S-box-containing protein
MIDLFQEPRWAKALIQSLPEALIAIDEQGNIRAFNHAAERITGWAAPEALGSCIDDVLRLALGRGPLTERLPEITAATPVNAVDRQGRELTLSIMMANVDAPEGAPRTVLLIRDVTSADAAQRLRSYFLANISHEFRTPLAALKASVELLLEGVNTFTQEETLHLARSLHFSVTSLQTLVDNLLESVSIETGRFRIRRKPTVVADLVAEAATLMKPLLERRAQTLVTNLPAGLLRVSVDPVRVTQVLVNLLSNASKYGPTDEPIELSAELQPEGVLRISVSDRGSGIPTDDKQGLFHRFIRLDGNDNAQYGIGLGLAVVKTIVESHGGAVGLDERPGGGSTFWFTIPLEEART